MELFFAPEGSIPPEAQFSMYGREHLLALAVIFLAGVVLLYKIRRMERGRAIRLFRVLSLFMVFLELLKDAILLLIGSFSIGYLPLHLCSIGMLYCVIASWCPNSPTLGNLLYSVSLPSALCALLFPDWTVFPFWHFQSLHSFVWHGLLLVCALIPLVTRSCRPSVKNAWQSMLILLGTAVPVYVFDRCFRTNYMFLLKPSPGSPLVLLGEGEGPSSYLFRLCLLVCSVILLLNLACDVVRMLFEKCVKSAGSLVQSMDDDI